MSHQPKISNNSSNNFLKFKKIKESSSEESILNNQTYFEKVYLEENINVLNVFTWGSNEMGQLGQEIENTTTKDKDGYSYSSFPINLNCLKHLRISWVSAGDGHTVSVSRNGTICSWRASACGQLGLEGIENMPRDSEGYPYQPIPMLIKLLNNVNVKELSCGDAHSIALTVDGRLFSWGGAGCGQLVTKLFKSRDILISMKCRRILMDVLTSLTRGLLKRLRILALKRYPVEKHIH